MNFKHIIFASILSILVFLLNGCGYKPSVNYAKNAISGKVYVLAKMDVENSSNVIYIKDNISNIILKQLDSVIVPNKANADTIVEVSLGSVSHSALQTDTEGYTRTYRTTVSVMVKYTNNISKKSDTISISDYYDYNIESDASLSELNKQNAINEAVKSAFSNILSKIAIRNL